MLLRRLWLAAVVVIPLQSPEQWHAPAFSRLPPNVVRHGADGLKISVDKSSSPLFYDLGKTIEVAGLIAEGTLSAAPDLSKGDDSFLRVGLVVEGGRAMSWIERLMAPKWVKQLAEIVPDGKIERVSFYKLDSAQRETRKHPKNDLIDEETAGTVSGPGEFRLEKTLSAPVPAFALWLQSDGDDTGAKFDVTLKALRLTTASSKSPTAPR